MPQRLIHSVVALCLYALVILVYYPGLQGPYVLDDEENITHNEAVAINEISLESISNVLVSNQSGLFKRPLASLSFAMNHYFAGGFENTLPLKLSNLVIHLVNGFLIYYLSLLMLRRPVFSQELTVRQKSYVAAFAALLWVLHPIQLTSVLYVVQRMTSLSALFVILGLIVFMHGRQSFTNRKSRTTGTLTMFAGVAGGTLLGVSAKENAVLLPLLALVTEFTLYRRKGLASSALKQLRNFYLLTVATPLAAVLLYIAISPEFILNAYAVRSFSPYERVLTETRVLWFYLSLLLIPGINRMGLFHDDIVISTGLFSPVSTFPSALGILAVLAFALLRRRQFPVLSFAVLWFFAGHSLESSIFGLEIAYEHRNYLPAFGPVLAAAYAILVLASKNRKKQSLAAMAVIPVAIVAIFAWSTWTWANTWQDSATLARHQVFNHPDSPRANNFAAYVAVRENSDVISAIEFTKKGIQVAPGEAGFRIDMEIFLAYLSSEINTSLSEKQIDVSSREFKFPELPDYIQARKVNGMLMLVDSESDKRAIAVMLRDDPIAVHGVVALDKLTECIINDVPHCRSMLPDAIEWLETAAENTRTSPDYRAFITANAAKLHAYNGNYSYALVYIDIASQMFPNTLYYKLGKAEYLIRLGQLDKAKAILDSTQQSGVSNRKDRQTMTLLREMLKDPAALKGNNKHSLN
jgi:protein O-mannosyl-transferase